MKQILSGAFPIFLLAMVITLSISATISSATGHLWPVARALTACVFYIYWQRNKLRKFR